MIDGVKILAMKNVVVVIRNVVVTSLVSTTTYCSVVEKLTTEFYVVINCINDGDFNDHG